MYYWLDHIGLQTGCAAVEAFPSDSKIITTSITAITFASSQSKKIKYQLEVKASIL